MPVPNPQLPPNFPPFPPNIPLPPNMPFPSDSMFAPDSLGPIIIPSWVGRIALPIYPIMPIVAYILLGLGLLLLLVSYFGPLKKLPAMLASLAMISYYPLAHLAHWLLFRYDAARRLLREPGSVEKFLLNHSPLIDWILLAGCIFFGLVFLVLTLFFSLRKPRRARVRESASPNNPFAQAEAPPPPVASRPAAPRPAAPRPAPRPAGAQQPAVHKVPKKPSAPASDNPFEFG